MSLFERCLSLWVALRIAPSASALGHLFPSAFAAVAPLVGLLLGVALVKRSRGWCEKT